MPSHEKHSLSWSDNDSLHLNLGEISDDAMWIPFNHWFAILVRTVLYLEDQTLLFKINGDVHVAS